MCFNQDYLLCASVSPLASWRGFFQAQISFGKKLGRIGAILLFFLAETCFNCMNDESH